MNKIAVIFEDGTIWYLDDKGEWVSILIQIYNENLWGEKIIWQL